MYFVGFCKLGSSATWEVFDGTVRRDVVSWTAKITGYPMIGCGMEALIVFEQMQLSGMKVRPCNLYWCIVSMLSCWSGARGLETFQLHD